MLIVNFVINVLYKFFCIGAVDECHFIKIYLNIFFGAILAKLGSNCIVIKYSILFKKSQILVFFYRTGILWYILRESILNFTVR